MGRILLTICAVVVAAALGAAAQQPNEPATRGGTSENLATPDAGDTDQVSALRDIARAVKEAAPTPPSPDEKQDAKDDVDAQRDMAFWALVVGLGTIAQFGVGVIGTIFLIKTLDHARSTSERELRAYLMLDTLGIEGVRLGGRPSVKFTLRNSGQTPAIDATMNYSIAIDDYPIRTTYPQPPGTEPPRAVVRVDGSMGKSITLDDPLDAAQIAALKEGRFAVYFTLRCTYCDIFGKTRSTESALFYNGFVGPIETHGLMSHLPAGNSFT